MTVLLVFRLIEFFGKLFHLMNFVTDYVMLIDGAETLNYPI